MLNPPKVGLLNSYILIMLTIQMLTLKTKYIEKKISSEKTDHFYTLIFNPYPYIFVTQ